MVFKTYVSTSIVSCTLALCSLPSLAVPVSGQGTWETTLHGRDLDGNLSTAEAYYDTILNITWLADANYALQQSVSTTGSMFYSDAVNWATNLDPYGSGITGWRLPNTLPIDGTTADDLNESAIGTEDLGYNVSAPGSLYAGSTASEMAHIFHNTLGNLSFCNLSTSTVGSCDGNQPGSGLTNTGPFSNLLAFDYWSGTEYVPIASRAWQFGMEGGYQHVNTFGTRAYAWAVHSGDVGTSVVPVPAAVWLFGSGLLGLIGLARRART